MGNTSQKKFSNRTLSKSRLYSNVNKARIRKMDKYNSLLTNETFNGLEKSNLASWLNHSLIVEKLGILKNTQATVTKKKVNKRYIH